VFVPGTDERQETPPDQDETGHLAVDFEPPPDREDDEPVAENPPQE
jgi:hypothetical protein